MWKVGGLKIVTAASRRIILPGWHRNWWKSAFFYKTLRTRKFSTWNFFEGSTHGILTHSRFRICVLKGLATHFWPCYSCPKSGEGGKTRFASIIKVVLKKKIRLPKKISCQVQLREVFIGVYNCVHVWTCICSCVQSIVFERLTHGSWRPMNLKNKLFQRLKWYCSHGSGTVIE